VCIAGHHDVDGNGVCDACIDATSCAPGYELTGECTTDVHTKQCVKITNFCSTDIIIDQGTAVLSGRKLGDTATIACNAGEEAAGDMTATCNVAGDGTAVWEHSAICGAQCDWTRVISTTNNDGVWGYSGSAWQSHSGFSNGDGFLAPQYSSTKVDMLRIVMNGRTEDFTLKEEHRNQHTLKELVNGPILTDYIESKGWANGAPNQNPWGLIRDGHESYVCHELSFNHKYYENSGAHNYARIGFSMSQEYGCGHPGTSEGLGMQESNHNDNLASGRLQWADETNYYHAAEVYVW
jgi:hypothetical protein